MISPPKSLAEIPPGATAIVIDISTDDVDAARIKRMGICEGRRIQLIKPGDPMIIRVVGTRVGLSAQLAPHIHVRMCEPGDATVGFSNDASELEA